MIRNGFNSRRTKYVKLLVRFFLTVDRPLSFSEIKEHTISWKHGMTGPELGNMLAKDGHFKQVGTVRSGGTMGDRWYVSTWVLKDPDEVDKHTDIHPKLCHKCGVFVSNNKVLAKPRCGKCYLAYKREERAKNGKA